MWSKGDREPPSGWVLNADLESNVGVVSLHNEGALVQGSYLGFYSPKHCVNSYLEAIRVSVCKYLAEAPTAPLTLVAHPWTTGMGRTLLKDVVRLTSPSSITEYYHEQSSLDAVLEDSSSLTGANAGAGTSSLSADRIRTFKVAKGKQSNIRETQQERLMHRLALTSWAQLTTQAPFHSFIKELSIFHAGQPLSPELYSGLIGKVCGLLKKTEEAYSCVGLGVVRDLNLQADLISLLTSADLTGVEALAFSSGEDALELPLEAFWSDKAQFSTELEQDFVFDDAVLAHKISRHHPGRSYLA